MGSRFKLFGKKKSGSDVVLALDIGTDLVKALVVEMSEDRSTGRVLGVGRTKQGLGDMQSGAVTDIEGVVLTCEDAIAQAEEMAEQRTEQVILGIAGELVKGSTTTVTYERSKPETRIDMNELQNIIQKVQWRAFDEVRKQLSWETGHKEIDVKLINAAVVDVKIDGYRVTNPLGFQGAHVAISVFNAYAPLVHLGALQTIADDLDLDLLSIAAEPYAVARCVGGEDEQEFSAIFIDVGGGTTDIAVVRNGAIEGTKMFGLGGRVFTKRIAGELGVSFDEAEELKMRYSAGELGVEQAKQIKDVVKNDIDVWLSGVALSLDEFSKSDLLPSRMLLCGGGSKLPEIRMALQQGGWHDDLPFARKPAVHFVKPEDVEHLQDETGELTSQQDVTPLGLASLALDMAGEEPVLSGLVRKAVRVMQR